MKKYNFLFFICCFSKIIWSQSTIQTINFEKQGIFIHEDERNEIFILTQKNNITSLCDTIMELDQGSKLLYAQIEDKVFSIFQKHGRAFIIDIFYKAEGRWIWAFDIELPPLSPSEGYLKEEKEYTFKSYELTDATMLKTISRVEVLRKDKIEVLYQVETIEEISITEKKLILKSKKTL